MLRKEVMGKTYNENKIQINNLYIDSDTRVYMLYCIREDQCRYTDFTGYRIVFWDYTIWIQTLAFSLTGRVNQSMF